MYAATLRAGLSPMTAIRVEQRRGPISKGRPDCAFSERAVIVISVFAIQHQMMVNASSARLSHDLSCVDPVRRLHGKR